MKDQTLAIHAGFKSDNETKAVSVPIYQTVAYEFDSAQHGADLFNLEVEGNIYTRIMNPTTAVLEERCAALEEGIAALGLSAGSGIVSALVENGLVILLSGVLIMLLPAVAGYCVGHFVLKMNPVLLLGAIAGAMTSTPGLKSINELADSNIPSLGYAGTYTFSNVFLTLGGAAMVSM